MDGGLVATRSKADKRKFLETAHKRFEQAQTAEHKLRELWLDDLKFEAGDQWPEAIRRIREVDTTNPRPCLTINKTQLHIRQVCNDIRQNRPQIKVLPVDGNADLDTADIYSGLIRNIEAVSDADIAYDTAVHPMVTAGIGYFLISTEVMDARLNLQEIRFVPIWNPLSVYMDPEIQHPAGADARWAFIVEDLPEATFKELYPKANAIDFKDKGRGDATGRTWFPDSNTIRVASYYYIEKKLKTFYETADGEIYDEEGFAKAGITEAAKTRQQYVNCCYWAKITGADILEETEVPSQYVPIIRCAGKETVVDGKRDVRGLVRDARDPARIYNYWVTLNTELIALAPKSPLLVAAEAIEGYQDKWDRANLDNLPYLPYNHVDDQGNPVPVPARAQPPQQSTAIVQAIMQADSDLMSVMGRFEASLGEGGNEKSGKAIVARQRQGDNATYHFTDNLTRAIRHAGRVVVDMIPKVYDTRRIMRVLGEDGSSDFAELDPAAPKAKVENQDLAGKVQRIYNLGVGRYDVTCIAGPSYATKRQEAAETLLGLSQADPTMMQKAGDLIVKSFDLPGSEELSKRLKAFLPPEVAQGDENDPAAQVMQARQMGQEEAMAQVQPVVQQMEQALQQASQEVEQAEKTIEQKDRDIAMLKQQLASREMEIMARQQEAQMKMEAEAAKSEQAILLKVLEQALMPEPEKPEEKEKEEKPEPEDKAMVSILQELTKPKRKSVKFVMDDSGMPIGAEVIEE